MGRMRIVAPVTALLVTLGVMSGCTKPSTPKPSPSPSVTLASPSASSSLATASASPTAVTVPVDQIPPGNPVSWIPAGVPTVAPYMEVGDAIPMFTPVMFTNTEAGAEAMAAYYRSALNWALASNSAKPFSIICTAVTCTELTKIYTQGIATGQHIVGQRSSLNKTPSTSPYAGGSVAQWAVRLDSAITAGKLVDASGRVVQTANAIPHFVTRVLLAWSGKIWRVVGDEPAQ